MGSGRTHPHTDMPGDGELARLISEKHPAHRDLYLSAHRLVLDAVPDLRYSVDLHDATIGYGARQFGYDGWGMAALMPHASWVSLVLFRGALLADPDELLEGRGARVRHVKLRSVEQLMSERAPLTRLLEEAAASADSPDGT